MSKLSEPEVLARMPEAKGWDRLGDMLVRTWHFASYRRALEFVNAAAALAEAAEHYPDLVLSYRSVRAELSTHSAGGLTPADFELAAKLSAVPTDR